MAQVASPSQHEFSRSLPNMDSAMPHIEMLPTPDFVFPRVDSTTRANHRRPMSMNMSAARPRTPEKSHRRGVSALPSFTFNAGDTSGLTGDGSEEQGNEPSPPQATSSRGGHTRNKSELVGGQSMTGVISASPTRPVGLPIPPTRHRHVRSRNNLSISGHDPSSFIFPAEAQPRLSSSLPNTPLEYPDVFAGPPTERRPTTDDGVGSSLENALIRPPSRPRVEFSDNVEYIPRPLSTISSETGSSMSTIRGHSVNNSISSVLSLGSPSPPSARARAISLETTLEDEPRATTRSSLDISRRVEREGQWLRTGSLANKDSRPISQSDIQPAKLTFTKNEPTQATRRASHKKGRSLSHGLGFDRRRSEPAMGCYSGDPSRLSALSLQEQALVAPYAFEEPPSEGRRSSSRKLKDWAVSKLSRKSREIVRPVSAHIPISVMMPEPKATSQSAEAETDLDAVFGLEADATPVGSVRARPVFDATIPFFNTTSINLSTDSDDYGTMLDLDAALGPFNTPPLGAQRPRRELHSSRGTKDFVGPGGHYLPNPYHRRTESAPMLTPFDQTRVGTPPQAAMDDVCEEDEDEVDKERLTFGRRVSVQSMHDDETGMGVQIVDSDISASSSTPSLSLDDGLRIERAEWEPERPNTSYGNLASRLSSPILDRRSSVIEDTIMEESSPVEPAIVEFHEEPRASSLTKSSDSSETPTILADERNTLVHSNGQHFLTAPGSDASSALSSPDLARRQNSFDTSRVGTSASSMTDNRTMSSCTTGETPHDVRISVDDVPSLTSSRSTMISTMQANSSRRDIGGARTPSLTSGTLDPAVASRRRRKRASIQSLSQLVGGSFGTRSTGTTDGRPLTASDLDKTPKKKEHRLKKLMFWKSKHRQASSATIS